MYVTQSGKKFRGGAVVREQPNKSVVHEKGALGRKILPHQREKTACEGGGAWIAPGIGKRKRRRRVSGSPLYGKGEEDGGMNPR